MLQPRQLVKIKRMERNARITKWWFNLCNGVDKAKTPTVIAIIWPYTPEDEIKLRLVRRYLNATIDFYEKPTLASCFRDIMVRITITK